MTNSNHLDPFLSPRTASAVAIPRIDADLQSTMVQIVDLPTEFIGGNIGRVAVNIAANRLLAAGAVPRYASAGVTIDTDTPVNTLNAMAYAMQRAAVEAEMEWAACNSGFTPSGPNTGVALSLFALGQSHPDFSTSLSGVCPGDALIVTAPVGTLGIAIEATRRGDSLTLDHTDGEPMLDAINELFNVDPEIHYMTLLERGLNMALSTLSADREINLDRSAIPVRPEIVEAAARMGLDPLDAHSSSAILIAVSASTAAQALAALRRTVPGRHAAQIAHLLP